MLSASSPLLVLLLTVLQLVLFVDAKGTKGSKGSKKSSKKKSKKKSKVKHVYKEDGKCYDEHHVEIECPAETNKALIAGIIAGVVAVIIILALAIWLFKRRSQKKKKSLNIKSRGIDDASGDHEFIVPLVREDTKDSDSLYSYKDKSMHV